MASTNAVTTTLVIFLVAGCFATPVEDQNPATTTPPTASKEAQLALTADAAVAAAKQLLGLGGWHLVSIGGVEQQTASTASHTDGGRVEEWNMVYYDVANNTVRAQTIRWDGTPLGITYHVNYGDISASVSFVDGFLIDSDTAGATGLASLSPPVTSLATGDRVNYWLSNIAGVPVWQVHFRPLGGTAQTLYVNGVSGAVMTPPTMPAPLSMGAAMLVAGGALGVPGAKLIEAIAVEAETATGSYYNGAYHDLEGVIVPPDLELGDGKALVWALIYRDFNLSRTIPVLVYAGLAPVVVLDYEHGWTNGAYEEAVLDLPVLEASEILEGFPLGRNSSLAMNLYQGGSYDPVNNPSDPVWRFWKPNTFDSRDYIFNAKDSRMRS